VSDHPASSSAPALVILAAGQARRYGGCKPLAPVGPTGEAIVDLIASDAIAAGFGRIVIVVNPTTGPAIRYHVARTWPTAVDVRFAVQPAPRGTVDAVLCALDDLPSTDHGFGVANADDLYGSDAMRLLVEHLGKETTAHALVGFRLRASTIGRKPVTRGLCVVDADGFLARIDERRQVTPEPGGAFVANDGREPRELDASAFVSMNLWAFAPSIRPVLTSTMARPAHELPGEVLLPELVGELVEGRDRTHRFVVLPTESRCIGVTHPDDLRLAQMEIAAQVGRGERPARLWSHLA